MINRVAAKPLSACMNNILTLFDQISQPKKLKVTRRLRVNAIPAYPPILGPLNRHTPLRNNIKEINANFLSGFVVPLTNTNPTTTIFSIIIVRYYKLWY